MTPHFVLPGTRNSWLVLRHRPSTETCSLNNCNHGKAKRIDVVSAARWNSFLDTRSSFTILFQEVGLSYCLCSVCCRHFASPLLISPPPPRTHTVSERYGCRFWWRQHQCEQALRFAVGRASLQAEYGRWSHYFSAQSRGVSSVLCRPTDWLCLTNWIQNKNKHFLIDMPLNFHYGKYCSVSRNENWKMKIVFLTGVTQDISASAAQMMYLFICLSSLSL